ncbi:MAG: hypothetical protein KZQ98_04205 [Candidatus Thiodiazotropha sp. (ex Lucinoma borealis)]|nr:hypothetical protein [Candidatus Thiodiazotropha sp. (ex Lucinoma borealis)]
MKLYHPPLIKLKRLATLTTIFILAMFMTVGGALADSDEDRHDDHSDGHSDGHGDGDGDGSSNNDYNLPKNSFNIMMNYELGMHCTGFEFAYCCVLPPYNSILAQVVKTQQSDEGQSAFARLLEGDPIEGLDALGRQTVLRDPDLDENGNFQKYVLEYWHDAQPRETRPNVVPQTSTLISATEGNSLLMWNTIADSAVVNPDGSLKFSGMNGNSTWNGVTGAMLGDGDFNDPTDNYWNAVWNHLYIFADLEGSNPTNSTAEADKIRLGVTGQIEYPVDCGAGLHPMGPVSHPEGVPTNPVELNDCGGASNGNVLTFSGEHGTVVYTRMKVLENLPITLTSPRIWEALGLPLTPFEDSINFFADPGAMFEDSVRPFVAMKARLRHYDENAYGGMGDVVLQNGNPVEGFGTAPIDIPNCERCHSEVDTTNSPHKTGDEVWSKVQQEYNFWMSYYGIGPGDSDWYPRLKSAAISILGLHDREHGTGFLDNYPACATPAECDALAADLSVENGQPIFAQSTRIGETTVLCQRCHADNVIAQVKSASFTDDDGSDKVILPMSEAIHQTHRGVGEGGPIAFSDSLGRFGGCQGCHPAHRSNGDMAGYPITETGDNFYASTDNRLGAGGCFVGRDVHSNPFKDIDGAGTPEHLTAIGEWLRDNVSRNQAGLPGGDRDDRGIWCTNCHNQLSQEIWKNENMEDLVHDIPGPGAINIRALASLDDIASAVGVDRQQALDWLDPRDPNVFPADGAIRNNEHTMAIWRRDPGLCDFLGGSGDPAHDAKLATIEVAGSVDACTSGAAAPGPDCNGDGNADFQICGSFDGDGDFSVSILDFCTTDDCVTAAQATLNGSMAAAVPFSAATDGRDHWLAAGEPHCADCHTAPYVEQSGHINNYPPFNYPRKASLMRYSRGHRDITCQGCHESIHGLYPVAPHLEQGPGVDGVDATSYAQAAYLNSDDSHGPLKCGSCHMYKTLANNSDAQIPARVCEPGEDRGNCDKGDGLHFDGKPVATDFDAAVSWAHTFTDEHDPRQDFCVSCHENENNEVSASEDEWLEHAMKGRVSRKTMDQVEILTMGAVSGTDDPRNSVCQGCHDDEWQEVACSGGDSEEWKLHLAEGRVAESVWEDVSREVTGTTCGW